tara:strand:+ start:15494 stop:15985 length:492 start_codon:yes stop_codon:yes gene_type:complete
MKVSSWLYISILLFIIIILLVLYILFNYSLYKPKYDSNIQPIQQTQPIIIQKNEDLPMYPRQDPKYYSEDFQQVGTLTSIDNPENPKILPLFGRKVHRDRWLYYSASETNNQLKVDVEYNNKQCRDKRVGCDELYDDEIVTIPSYNNQQFKVTKYDYKSIDYN